ncbi:hypothetical protein NLJ89_g9225 [Agrocybe chaxingu]|uniref:Uncharacterized protein n=1 Tax=Agrocybe chaxingu TaxID=84603 RepID=A0A9W8JT50_9AGAR|nr:hypothetical protein NLJ89_g9225 [Agrocybe chaxingu]
MSEKNPNRLNESIIGILIMSHQQDGVRSVIKQWLDSIARRDWAALSSLATPDATYWIAGLKSNIPYAGTELYSE